MQADCIYLFIYLYVRQGLSRNQYLKLTLYQSLAKQEIIIGDECICVCASTLSVCIHVGGGEGEFHFCGNLVLSQHSPLFPVTTGLEGSPFLLDTAQQWDPPLFGLAAYYCAFNGAQKERGSMEALQKSADEHRKRRRTTVIFLPLLQHSQNLWGKTGLSSNLVSFILLILHLVSTISLIYYISKLPKLFMMHGSFAEGCNISSMKECTWYMSK